MINVVKKYLEKNGYGDQKEDFENYFSSHPNYPSVFAITDSLDMLSIECLAVKVPKQQFEELPDLFLAVYKQEMVLVSKKDASVSIQFEKGTKRKLSFNEFLTDWNGVVLAIESTNQINNYNKSIDKKWFSYILLFTVLILLSVVFNVYSLTAALVLSTSLIGLIISVLIVQEKFGIANVMVSKFCNASPNISCDSVIKSNRSNINKWINFSDLPLLFFAISTMSILIQPMDSSIIIGFLSFLSLPIIFYSIWVQKFQLKKWCLLCLVVSFVILIQGLVFGFESQHFTNIFTLHFFEFLFSTLLFTSLWLFIKPVLSSKIKGEKEVNELKKFKRNYGLFNFLTKEIPALDGFEKLEGLRFGNVNSDVQLTIIISPSCGYCHKVFEEAFELVSKFPKRIFLKVLFNINPENNQNQYKTVVENLLTIHNLNPEKAEEAIIDWHIKKMELAEWKNKWMVEFIDMKANHQIQLQYDWCLKNQFNYTPVKMVNDKQFPNAYEISELKCFLNDFSEDKQILESNFLVEA